MKIKSIQRFDNPMEILQYYLPELTGNLTEDEQEELRCCCDYESIVFYVVNDSIVLTVDTITDDVLGEDALSRFAAESMKWARENA